MTSHPTPDIIFHGDIERAEASVSVKTVDKIIQALSIRYEDFFAKSDCLEKKSIAHECYDRISSMRAKQQMRTLVLLAQKVAH